jgi:ADP-ribosylglycohydrolase/fructose-1,6-bisphosphatase/inositol monophosphatase family enzyme
VLELAENAAREAGTILLADFLRPGGPRRHNADHAHADEEAEALIRARLLAATPKWSYRGEETGWQEGTEGHHVWLIDPNDGTAAYLKGWRGSAVSIGLLRDGVPVLGVVYAFAAPDNTGDVLAWGEGCGPLRRNGEPVDRAPLPDALASDVVIGMTPGADRKPLPNARCLEPARWLNVTSIAYRLALLAAGDVDGVVCLSGPGDWDYAGGHALIRAVGGELVNERGEPVTYTLDGVSQTESCFAASPRLARELASRPWGSLAAGPRAPEEMFDLTRPTTGCALADDGLLRRVRGCWLGQICGDALGSMTEFQSAEGARREYPSGLRTIGPSPVWRTIAGQPTDDSELALVLGRTLLEHGFNEERIARGYAWWRDSGPFDIGSTIGRATAAMSAAVHQGRDIVEAAHRAASRSSESNGALMRQSVLAIWGHALDPVRLDEIVRRDTSLTHPNPVCLDASTAFIVALADAIREGLNAEDTYEHALAWHEAHGISASVGEALKAAAREMPVCDGASMGHVIRALQAALHQALHAPSFEEGVVRTVMAGGDTDTNGAIAGALLGAIHGIDAIPRQWQRAVLSCRPQAGLQGVTKPRPRAFWPCDATVLAERLAVSSRAETDDVSAW